MSPQLFKNYKENPIGSENKSVITPHSKGKGFATQRKKDSGKCISMLLRAWRERWAMKGRILIKVLNSVLSTHDRWLTGSQGPL